MTSTVVEHASIEAKVVNAEHVTVNIVREERVAMPDIGWYPKAYFKSMHIPESLLDDWVATGDVRAKKASDARQSTRFLRLADVMEKLESMTDVKPAEA